MRAVRGEVVSSKPVSLTKATRVFSLFASFDESRLPSDGGALLLCVAEAALELHAFRHYASGSEADGQSAEKRPKKRKRKNEAARESDAADRDV
ncbi:hypothetical protein ABZP36_006007 [Zizania latifolia]